MRLARIADLSKAEQTDKVKTDLYNLVKQFVYKYHTRYYPHYKGELEDLIMDIYIQFMTPKSRKDGQEESLLDKFNPEITTLPYLVKSATIRMLIDRERTDKKEINYSEKYDEETGDLSLDWLVNRMDDKSVQVEDMEFTPEEVASLKANYKALIPQAKEAFLQEYEEQKDVLSDNFKKLFAEIVGEDRASGKRVKKLGSERKVKLTGFPEAEEFATAFPQDIPSDANFRGEPAIKITATEPEKLQDIQKWMEEHGYETLGTYHSNNIYFKRHES